MNRPIRGVLFDSGGTLVGPAGGRWNPRFDFENVLRHHEPEVDMTRFPDAVRAGDDFLAGGALTPDRDDYHRVVLEVLGVTASKALLADLTRPAPGPIIEPFAEVGDVIAVLHALGISMAIVTDNWGTSEGFLDNARAMGWAGITACVVSSELGCTKPDPRMYRTASDALGLEPEDCLFVDDVPKLVDAAIDLGYRGAVICRPPAPHPTSTPWIESLTEILDLVQIRT